MTANSSAAKQVAALINALDPLQRSGFIRIWGEWIGRPCDDHHTSISCKAENECVIIDFKVGERLTIWNPKNVIVTPSSLIIRSATRVHWGGQSNGDAGLPRPNESLRGIDYRRGLISISRIDESGKSGWKIANILYPALVIGRLNEIVRAENINQP